MPACSKGFAVAVLLGLASCAATTEPRPARAEARRPEPSRVDSEPRPEPPPRDDLPAPDGPPPGRVGVRMEFHDADVKTVLLALAEEAGVSIVLPGDIRGAVTCILEDVSWLDALHAVAETAGYVVVHEGRRPALILR